LGEEPDRLRPLRADETPLPVAQLHDHFEWREDGKAVVHDTHALRTLTKPPPDTNIQTTLREIVTTII